MSNYKTIAKAVRVELDQHSGKFYVVFEVTDEQNKLFIRNNWINDDIEFELINKELVIKE